MSKIVSKIACLFVAMSVVAVAPAAMANHHGKKHHHHDHKNCDHKPDNSVFITSNDKSVIQEYLAQDYKDNCPKGLAKKGTCASSYAKKRYSVGQPLSSKTAYRPLPGYVVHDLQPVPNGYRYGIVDNDVVLIFAPTKRVIDAVSLRN